MNCFNHPDKSAIGICKACGKGLCKECAADLGHGLACKDSHESDVENLHMIVAKNVAIYSAAPKNSMLAPLFSLVMGLVFVVYGFTYRSGVTDLTFVLGIGFVVYGLITLVRNRALFGKNTR